VLLLLKLFHAVVRLPLSAAGHVIARLCSWLLDKRLRSCKATYAEKQSAGVAP
jgi:hypothetical protein